MSESRALIPSLAAGARPTAVVPTTFEDCWRIAQMLSQSSMVPQSLKGKAEDCCAAIMHGLEIGLPPLQALQSIALINGRPSVWGDGALAIVRASGLLESIEESDDGQVATCVVKRRGEPKPIVRSFSMEDAKRAQLASKTGPWTQYPQRMRQMRARSWALRDGFADVMRGLHVAEEAEDIPVRDITPPRERRAAAPAGPVIPDIPDAPPPPPLTAAPDLPDHDPETGEVRPTDVEFLAGLEAHLGQCATEAAIAEAVEANKAEVEERGLEQAANDLVGKRRARLAKALGKAKAPAATPKSEAQVALEETYVAIGKAMRNADSLETLTQVWKQKQEALKTLPANWRTELEAEKDRIKAQLSQPQGAAA